MTSTASVPVTGTASSARLPYGALLVMMCLSFLLVTAEFLPNGILTEMAAGLGISPGQAGQTVTVTAIVGLVVALTVGVLFPRLDRRTLLMATAAAAAVSNILVAVAPNLVLILLARVLLGAAISAFWAMSITVVAAMVGTERVGRAAMFTTAGLSLATVAGVPLGVLLSEALDWRAAFLIIGIASAVLVVPLGLLLPPVPAASSSGLRPLVDTLRRPGVALGLAGHVLAVLGHFLAYTYVRVSLERLPDIDAGTVVLLLALFGVGGLIGNFVIGAVIDRTFVLFGVVAPLVIGASIAVLLLAPASVIAVGVAVTVWGFFFSSWLIITNAWVGHRMPDRLEAGGSLVVVGFQLGIVLAAGLGGIVVDTWGVALNDVLAIVLLLAGAALFGAANRGHGRRH
ncbi:MFS transporter [Microbacterium sp. SORGH_AS_0888]|uniref:MFS transporter n=1 Tax=Microbacterium sp. SORGH_AS_0888 TaxID=3041791 RepID=UPI0027D92C97|nr:MFS transporter [Microbacterium sp. SORGH_AS_0888]